MLAAWVGVWEPRKHSSRFSSKTTVRNQMPQKVGKVFPTLSKTAGVNLPASFHFVLIAVTLFSLGNSSDMFLVLRAQNVGIRVALAPLLGLVFNITYTLGSWPAGWFSDRVSRRADCFDSAT